MKPLSRKHKLAALCASFSLAIALFAFLLAVLCNSLSPGFASSIAAGIPFVRNFIAKTWPTFLYAQSRTAEARLSLARMDIDFLLSIEGPEGRYMELCPYTVEGFLEMGTVVDEEPSRSFSIAYAGSFSYGGGGTAPSSAAGSETRAWRAAEDFVPDWNSVLVPFHQAFRERAYDIAVSDPSFGAECRRLASERIAAVYGDSPDSLIDSANLPGPVARSVSAGFLPVAVRTAERIPARRNTPAPIVARSAEAESHISVAASPAEPEPRIPVAARPAEPEPRIPIAARSAAAEPRIPVAARPASALRDDSEFSVSVFDPGNPRLFRLTPAGKPLAGSSSAPRLPAAKSFAATEPDALWRAFASRNAGTNLVFRYHDPLDPRRLSCFGFADARFDSVFSVLRGVDEILCVESLSPNADRGNSAPAASAPDGSSLYLAFSLETASFSLETAESSGEAERASRLESRSQWDAYRTDYEIALEELRAGRRGRRYELSRRAMLNSASRIADLTGLGPWTDAALFEAPENGTVFSALLEDSAVSVLFAQEAGILASLLEGGLPAYDRVFRSDGDRALSLIQGEETAGQLAAFFWSIRRELSLSENEERELLEDIIGSGAAVNKALLTELDRGQRNALLAAFVSRRLDAAEERALETDETLGGESWLWYGAGALDRKARKGRLDAARRLEELGHVRGDSLILVYADPPSRKGFFTRYDALALDSAGVSFYPDFLRWMPSLVNPVRIGWGDIVVSDSAVLDGDRVLSPDPMIAGCLRLVRDSWNAGDYNRERACELLRSDLDRELTEWLDRPRFP